MSTISVANHGAVKRTCGTNKWESNHVAGESIGVDTFMHLHARRLISYTYAVLSSHSPCLTCLSNYFRFMSQISSNVERLFRDNYQLDNAYRNPLCAVFAMFQFVQRNEPRLSDLRIFIYLKVKCSFLFSEYLCCYFLIYMCIFCTKRKVLNLNYTYQLIHYCRQQCSSNQ